MVKNKIIKFKYFCYFSTFSPIEKSLDWREYQTILSHVRKDKYFYTREPKIIKMTNVLSIHLVLVE